MATEVESTWSPAKRFTLVKPTFKGIESQKLSRSYLPSTAGEVFGSCTAVSDDGSTLVVTSYMTDNQGGSLYVASVFVRSGSIFSFQQTLLSPDSYQSGTLSEQNVSISGDGNTIALGLFGSGAMASGKVSIFTKVGTTWEHQALLTPSVQTNGQYFGAAVSLSYDGTVCGIGTSESSTAYSPGSAYVFVKSGGVWSQQTKIDPPDGIHGGYFGRFLSISGDGNTLAVSAVSSANSPLMPYIYVRSGSAWNLQSRLVLSDGGNYNVIIGVNIALSSDGNTCGFLSHSINPGMFLFERTGSTWTQTAKILTGLGPVSSHMSRDGTTCIVGSVTGHGAGGSMTGNAHVSVKRNGVWSGPMRIIATDGLHDDRFGNPVLLSGDGTLAFVGAVTRDYRNRDSVYVFV